MLPLRLGGDGPTGWSAEQHARLCADLVAIKRTAPLCAFTWTVAGADQPPVVVYYFGMNGEGLGFAPTNLTAGSGGTAGAIIFRFATGRFVDPYEVGAPFKPRQAKVTLAGTTYRKGMYTLLSDGVSIKAFDAAGSLVNPCPSGSCVLW
jgi:hypothetical protein